MSQVIWAVGDGYNQEGVRIGEMIANSNPSLFLYLGDVYDSGTIEEYEYYNHAFGKLKSITHAIPGNHDHCSNLQGYRNYWGHARPYYSFEFCGWKFFCLDSLLECHPNSSQYLWVERQSLHWNGPVTLCFHEHLFSAGGHGDLDHVGDIIQLFSNRTCIGLSGHTHNMQRFKPVSRYTQFVVGSGGQTLYPLNYTDDRLAWAGEFHGALKLVYSPEILYHEFVGIDGKVLDSGRIFVDNPVITYL